MAMIMPRNKYISNKHVLYHLYLALGRFCAAYKFVCSRTGNVGEEPVEEVRHLHVDVQTPQERKSQRRRGMSAVYSQTHRLSLHCLPPAEGVLSNRGRVVAILGRTGIGIVLVGFVCQVRYIFSS